MLSFQSSWKLILAVTHLPVDRVCAAARHCDGVKPTADSFKYVHAWSSGLFLQGFFWYFTTDSYPSFSLGLMLNGASTRGRHLQSEMTCLSPSSDLRPAALWCWFIPATFLPSQFLTNSFLINFARFFFKTFLLRWVSAQKFEPQCSALPQQFIVALLRLRPKP